MEALGIARALDELEPEAFSGRGRGGLVALIAGVGVKHLEPGKMAAEAPGGLGEAVAVLEKSRAGDAARGLAAARQVRSRRLRHVDPWRASEEQVEKDRGPRKDPSGPPGRDEAARLRG